MKPFFLIYFLALLLGQTQSASATSTIRVVKSSEEIIAKATDIVEGKVVDVISQPNSSNAGCFSYVYKLRVTKTYKGKTDIGSEVTVGLNIHSLEVNPDQLQLLVLREISEEYYDFCSADDLEKSSVRYITSGLKTSVVELFPTSDRFLAVVCEREKPLLFTALTSNEARQIGACTVVQGKKSELVAQIEKALKDAKVSSK